MNKAFFESRTNRTLTDEEYEAVKSIYDVAWHDEVEFCNLFNNSISLAVAVSTLLKDIRDTLAETRKVLKDEREKGAEYAKKILDKSDSDIDDERIEDTVDYWGAKRTAAYMLKKNYEMPEWLRDEVVSMIDELDYLKKR